MGPGDADIMEVGSAFQGLESLSFGTRHRFLDGITCILACKSQKFSKHSWLEKTTGDALVSLSDTKQLADLSDEKKTFVEVSALSQHFLTFIYSERIFSERKFSIQARNGGPLGQRQLLPTCHGRRFFIL